MSNNTASPQDAAVSELADAVGRAAHDLNNLCASMLGFAALSRDSLDPASSVHAYLTEIVTSAEKTATLAEHLRRLAHAARVRSS